MALDAATSVLDPRVIRLARVFRGLSLDDVARLTGISTSALSRLERGIHPITAEHANRLAVILGPVQDTGV